MSRLPKSLHSMTSTFNQEPRAPVEDSMWRAGRWSWVSLAPNVVRVIRLLLSACSCVALCSCTPFPRSSGPYAHSLSFGDIVQIRAIVQRRRDVRQSICDIKMESPDRARVSAGPDCNGGGVHVRSEFVVRKKNGHWTIDESSIQEGETITTIDEVRT